MPTFTTDSNARIVMCDECGTTRTVAHRYPITRFGRYLTCATCERPTTHHTTDAADDFREQLNADRKLRDALRKEIETLAMCRRLGVQVRVRDLGKLRAGGAPIRYGFIVDSDRTAIVEVSADLTPEGRAIAIRRALVLAFSCAHNPSDGWDQADPALDAYVIKQVQR